MQLVRSNTEQPRVPFTQFSLVVIACKTKILVLTQNCQDTECQDTELCLETLK